MELSEKLRELAELEADKVAAILRQAADKIDDQHSALQDLASAPKRVPGFLDAMADLMAQHGLASPADLKAKAIELRECMQRAGR